MGLTLNEPGELSGWLSLAAALRKKAALDAEGAKGAEATDEEAAAAAKDLDESAKMLDGVEVRVRTMQRRERLELAALTDAAEGASGFKLVIVYDDTNAAVMRAGLAAIRGLERGDTDEVNDSLFDALEATKLHTIISWVVTRFNSLKPAERAAFFT